MRKSRQLLSILMILAMVSIAIAGCSKETKEDTTEETPVEASTEAEANEEEEPSGEESEEASLTVEQGTVETTLSPENLQIVQDLLQEYKSDKNIQVVEQYYNGEEKVLEISINKYPDGDKSYKTNVNDTVQNELYYKAKDEVIYIRKGESYYKLVETLSESEMETVENLDDVPPMTKERYLNFEEMKQESDGITPVLLDDIIIQGQEFADTVQSVEVKDIGTVNSKMTITYSNGNTVELNYTKADSRLTSLIIEETDAEVSFSIEVKYLYDHSILESVMDDIPMGLQSKAKEVDSVSCFILQPDVDSTDEEQEETTDSSEEATDSSEEATTSTEEQTEENKDTNKKSVTYQDDVND